MWTLDGVGEIDAAELRRAPLWTDRRAERGPFDVIGDVHGCYEELVELLGELGYRVDPDGHTVTPPAGRRAVFVGDYVDRGPDTPAVLRLVMAMAAAGTAICLPGNHDAKLVRKLKGRDVKITHGLAETLAQLEPEPAGVPRGGPRFPRPPGQPRRPRRRRAGRRPRRPQGGLPGPLVGPGPRLRPVRRNDRRDRRVRAADPRRLGGRLPRRGGGRLRPHHGRGAALGQRHDRHRHRLRLRRPPDGAALARARAGLGGRRSGPTTSRSIPGRRSRATPSVPPSCSTSTTSPASASSRPAWRGP